MILFAQQVQVNNGFTFHVDLGQVIIATLIAIVGFFIKRMIDDFGERIDKHEKIIFTIANDVQFIIGAMGIERRQPNRRITNGEM